MPTTVHQSQVPGEPGLHGARTPLVETMELVEPLKDMKPPDHLVDSKIYSTVGRADEIEALPSAVHFGGFELGQTHTQSLRLLNISGDVQRMHIVPPQTKYFNIKYKKGKRMVAGMALECTVEFTPDEWRYFYDCIRVHCPGTKNLIIPVHAYPVMCTDDFPEYVTFPETPVGSKAVRTIPLRSSAPIDFEFQLSCVQPHSAFVVEPMSGVVPATGEVVISVTFSPVEFSSALMKLQLSISQFNSKPLVCTFIGRSSPGLLRDKVQEECQAEGAPEEEILDPRTLSAVERSRTNKQKIPAPPKYPKPKEVEVEGIMVPTQLDNPWAVSQVLNQQPGKLRAKDIRQARERGVLLSAKTPDKGVSSRPAKTAKFEAAVRRNVYEERQNQLRWQVKVGEEPMTSQQRQRVTDKRSNAWNEYRLGRGDPVVDEEYVRRQTHIIDRRTRRDKDHLGAEGIQFDKYSNDPWQRRNTYIEKFFLAGRKIVIRIRAERYLQCLRQVVQLCRQGMPTAHAANLVGKQHNQVNTEAEEEDILQEPEEGEEAHRGPPKPLHLLRRSAIMTATFPTYVAPDAKDDMAADALGQVPYYQTEVEFRRKVPYYTLHVPQTYKLMGYRKMSVLGAATGYVSPKITREMRTGAEDEVINIPPLPTAALSPRQDDELHMDDLEPSARDPQDLRPSPEPLMAPEGMIQPVSYPPLHIFNPSPGLQVYMSPLPYAETDSDFHLCPLPRYTVKDAQTIHGATQKRYLHREDTIRGVMQWKKMASQGLTSLANTPTLTAVWVPRWSDPFQSSLLPVSTPELQTGLSAEDQNNLTPSADEPGTSDIPDLALTPEMVSAQFSTLEKADSVASLDQEPSHEFFPHGSKMPSTNLPVGRNGPVPRERREQELDYFIKRKSNKLGSRLNTRLKQLDDCKTDSSLLAE